MGGRGSGGNRVGSGRKKKTDLERAIAGTPGTRGIVLQHPAATFGSRSSSSSTAVAPVSTFGPPAELQQPAPLAALTSALERLRTTPDPDDRHERAQLQGDRADLQDRVDAMTALGLEAVAVWHELAPHAFDARTLTPATTAAFVMLCRGIAIERALSTSPTTASGPNHRGLMARVATWMKDFGLAPLGKPMYAEEATPAVNPLDRFTQTKGRA